VEGKAQALLSFALDRGQWSTLIRREVPRIHLTSGWMVHIVRLNVLTKSTVTNLSGTLFGLMVCFWRNFWSYKALLLAEYFLVINCLSIFGLMMASSESRNI
jgi:hypothetical protein